MHICTLQPVKVSSFLHDPRSLCCIFFFFLFPLFFILFFSFEIYKNRLCTMCCLHRFRVHLCDSSRVHMRINYSKRNFLRLHSFFERGHSMEKKITEINIPTPLGPLSRFFVFLFFFLFLIIIIFYYFIFYLLNSSRVLR